MREGLEFETGVRSDTAPLSTLVGAILAAGDRMAAGIKHALQWRLQVRLNVCFKLGQTNGWRCAECDSVYPHYRNGYSCAGTFLLYLEGTYNSNLVWQLNTALRQGRYSDDFFLNTATKRGDPSTYHYTVSRPTEVSAWKLLRAWRSDVEGRVAEEYCVP